MPAYGGGLFDPTRFAFLNQPGLRIDNRTVLHLLESLQYLEVAVPGGDKQSRRLSFRALDIEQIGHVYEGLFDHTAVRAGDPVVGLVGTSQKEPEVSLHELEARQGDRAKLLAYLKDQSGRSPKALENALDAGPPDLLRANALRSACDNNDALYQRVLPWQGLIRDDDYGRPVIFPGGSVYVTAGAERRATGTHYTPRSLTEPIVQHTLEPLVYVGPAQGKPREEWALHTLDKLLDLKVCDMAMGSGAFLVQACRYLSERVVEAYEQAVRLGQTKRLAAASPLAALHAATDDEERLLLARRLVASRCLYGVDKNPLAVEMAKLSLWLITLDQGRPFTFLDHALKCGDSLVGVDLAQLRRWSLHADVTAPMDALHIDVDIARMVRLRQEIEALPSLDIRDQEAKKLKLAQADAIAHDLKRAGDMLVASYYNTLSKPQQERLRAALLTVVRTGASLDAEWHADTDLGNLQPFHWPLEFPEVFLGDEVAQSRAHGLARLTTSGTLYDDDNTSHPRTGFDAFVGNPPFIGGRRIRESLGDAYRGILDDLWPESSGNADYCTFFFLRGFRHLRKGGTLGLIATNTIAQGDTRLTGLAKIEEFGGVIYAATNNTPWPGLAAVVINTVHIGKGAVTHPYALDGKIVDYISTQLDDRKVIGEPYPLGSNRGWSFQGSLLRGMGFILSADEADELVEADSRNLDVVKPYISGDDLNTTPDQSASRWVIDFQDWPLSKAETYTRPINVLMERVYPERMGTPAQQKIYRNNWWRFWRPRAELYATIEHLPRVLVTAIVSKYVNLVFQPINVVFMHKLCVFPFYDTWAFSLLQSTIHTVWAWSKSSTLGAAGLNYSPSDVFDTFPFPDESSLTSTTAIGDAYYGYRRQLMLSRKEGLTTTYNRFHNAGETAEDIARLRQLHVEMDNAVAAAYGWGDLDLGHGFHETPQGIRYTIAEAARRTVLTRLLELNHARYAEEVKAGLHDKKKGKGKSKAKRASKKNVADGQMEML